MRDPAPVLTTLVVFDTTKVYQRVQVGFSSRLRTMCLGMGTRLDGKVYNSPRIFCQSSLMLDTNSVLVSMLSSFVSRAMLYHAMRRRFASCCELQSDMSKLCTVRLMRK